MWSVAQTSNPPVLLSPRSTPFKLPQRRTSTIYVSLLADQQSNLAKSVLLHCPFGVLDLWRSSCAVRHLRASVPAHGVVEEKDGIYLSLSLLILDRLAFFPSCSPYATNRRCRRACLVEIWGHLDHKSTSLVSRFSLSHSRFRYHQAHCFSSQPCLDERSLDPCVHREHDAASPFSHKTRRFNSWWFMYCVVQMLKQAKITDHGYQDTSLLGDTISAIFYIFTND